MSKLNVVPSVAVCLAVYKGMRWLPEQLGTILNQHGVAVTVFVSVDASDDGSEAWIDEQAAGDSRIHVLAHGQRFGGAARNFFRLIRDVDFSEFDYVSFADQDDIWLQEKLERAVRKMGSAGADAYSSNVMAFWPDGRQRLIEKSYPQVQWDYLFESAGPGCTYVFTQSLAIAIQQFVKNHWDAVQLVGLHDWLAYAFARANGFRWVIDDFAGMLYRQHDENQVGANSGWRPFVYRARKVLDGWGLNQAGMIAQLVALGDDSFVRRWIGGGRLGALWLALHSNRCRRRARDRVLFGVSCVAIAIIGRPKQ